MFEILGSVVQIMSTLFANNPIALVAMAFLVILIYVFSRISNKVIKIFDKHMGDLSNKIESMSQSMATMSRDFTVLSSSFEVHVAKTEIKIDVLEKRTDKLENIHLNNKKD